ncbi:hypothetical protein [Nostoc sp. DedSLP04]|uniref:hypothetical protein n=1 Tax=Nostoc sp. DedSLP04 TaxID=3075401 RepID=UPI002AD54B25|nr:hypothetical protein [Nostoc sp. DedSLP04]MDZ8032957.1 hypothetical protein [Nostoc sp. DedSLP04]
MSAYSCTTGARIVFKVFMQSDRPQCHHTISDRFIFEVFCKAIPTVSYANALTLGQQAMSNDKPLRVYTLFLGVA